MQDKDKSFSKELMVQIREKFSLMEKDDYMGKRLFFENAGGSLRLKEATVQNSRYDIYPDCSERLHPTAKELKKVHMKGLENIRTFLNANDGLIYTSLTASQAMYEMTWAVIENIPGTNVVNTCLDHPSQFDSAIYYARKNGKIVRTANANPNTGSIDIEDIISLIDQDTCLLSIIYASNITGGVLDMANIAKEARKIKSDLYIIVDAVQHAPHGPIDVNELQVDGLNIAPYKCFGNRGVAFSYFSERLAQLQGARKLSGGQDMWNLGSPTPQIYAGFSAVYDYIKWIGSHFTKSNVDRDKIVAGMNAINEHEKALMYRLFNGSENSPGLCEIQGVNVLFNTEDLSMRDLIIPITFDNIDCTNAVKLYAERGIIVYDRVSSSPYSKRMLDAFGLDGIVRVSPLHCHTLEEMDHFLDVTQEICQLSIAQI